MTTTIAIVTGTPDRKGPSTDGGNTYPLVPGRMSTSDLLSNADSPLFDTMLALAADELALPFDGDTINDRHTGPTWHTLTPNWVAGIIPNIATGDTSRIAVIDLDNANGLDVLKVINWVNHIDGADLPG